MGSAKLDYDKMTNEEILELFKEQYKKIQPNDAVEYMKKCGEPSIYILKKKLGLTYGEALVIIGERKQPRKKYKKDTKHINRYYGKYKNKMIEIYNKLGYIPNSSEIIKYGLSQSNIYTVLGMNYSEFVESIGYSKKDIKGNKNRVEETDEELLKMYINLCIKIGRIATSRDIDKNKEMPCSGTYIYRFGSINEVKRLSNVEESALDKRVYTKSYIIKNLKEMYIDYGRRLKREEIENQTNNYFERGIAISTIFNYFKTTNIKEVWQEVEKSLIRDYIKLLKKNEHK